MSSAQECMYTFLVWLQLVETVNYVHNSLQLHSPVCLMNSVPQIISKRLNSFRVQFH